MRWEKTMFELGPELRTWIEQGQSICIKAVTELGDPVELSTDEARALAKALLDFVDAIEASD